MGYKWNPREDVLAPGLGELNFSKKDRAGAKTPNKNPVVIHEDAEALMKDLVLTRQAVSVRIAEIARPFDRIFCWSALLTQLLWRAAWLSMLEWRFLQECTHLV